VPRFRLRKNRQKLMISGRHFWGSMWGARRISHQQRPFDMQLDDMYLKRVCRNVLAEGVHVVNDALHLHQAFGDVRRFHDRSCRSLSAPCGGTVFEVIPFTRNGLLSRSSPIVVDGP
jgi:hypothetical protein